MYNHVEHVCNGLNINKVCVDLLQNNVHTKRNKNISRSIFCRSMKNIDTFSDKMINILLSFRTNPSNYHHFDPKY